MAIQYEDFLYNLEVARDYGKYISALCVFHHETNPSMLVFRDGWFRCLSCNRHGTWKTLWNKIQGQPISVSPEKITRWGGPQVKGEDLEEICYQAHADLMQFDNFKWYMEMRGVQNRIEPCEIGYWKGWYSFPVRDAEGIFQTAVFRSAPHVEAITGTKYWCHHDPVPYVPSWPKIETGKNIIVVFGMIDALVMADLLLPVVTSTSGKDSFKPEWLDDYRKKIYIIPDRGEEDTALRLESKLGWRGHVLRLDYPDGIKDPADFYSTGRKDDLIAQIGFLF